MCPKGITSFIFGAIYESMRSSLSTPPLDQRCPKQFSESIEEATSLMSEDGRQTTEANLELAEARARLARPLEDLRSIPVLVCVEDLSHRKPPKCSAS